MRFLRPWSPESTRTSDEIIGSRGDTSLEVLIFPCGFGLGDRVRSADAEPNSQRLERVGDGQTVSLETKTNYERLFNR